jgi:hypothetical protein
MTFLVYIAWYASLLLLAGELDRRFTRRLTERVIPELSAFSLWFMPAVGSAVLPGAGQFLNSQPLKALVAFSWPILFGMIPRAWQFLMIHTYVLLIPWWITVVLDALIVGVLRHRRMIRDEAPAGDGKVRKAADLSDFLSRRTRR